MKGLIHRAHVFCDKQEDLKTELDLLIDVFIANGYPEKLVRRTVEDSWKTETLKAVKKMSGGKAEEKSEFIHVLNGPYVHGF